MNWKQLKDFCNNLTDEQLNEKVLIWREEEIISAIEVVELEEDYYIDEDYWPEGCAPESECLNIIEINPENYPNGFLDLKKCYKKGHSIIQEIF